MKIQKYSIFHPDELMMKFKSLINIKKILY
jgi:hypothetical protein